MRIWREQMIKKWVLVAFGVPLCSPAFADDDGGGCSIPLATVTAIQNQLNSVVTMKNGGIFGPSGIFPTSRNFMWSAVVDRAGRLCSVIKTGDAWPGSRAIAIAKAGTANDFSNASLALSTANLYAATQPGGSLWGLNNPTHSTQISLRLARVPTSSLEASLHSAAGFRFIKMAPSSEVWASAAIAPAPIM
jgi:hypothetical protein